MRNAGLDELQTGIVGLKLNIKKKKTKIMASGPITSWQIGKSWKQ